MRYRTVAMLAIAALTLIAGCISYHCFHRPISAATDADTDQALTWVEHEFKLSGEKLARVKAMHEAYQGVCAEHCRVIAEAREDLQQLEREKAPVEQIAAATTKVQAAEAMCIASTRQHVREVAAVIGGAAGERYLATVLPRVSGFDHSGPPTLDMNKNTAHDSHKTARR